MPLLIPQLDARTYSQILQEALARIPVHNPEWTNFNDSDPGVTLLQLFSFMSENIGYRANLIPERNHLKFLQLIGKTLRPPSVAQGVATITNDRGPLQTITLPASLAAQAGKIGFMTQNGLDVLPIEMQVYYRQSLTADQQAAAQATYDQLYATIADDTVSPASLDFYQTVPFAPPASAAAISSISLTDGTTVDGSLWLALLTRSAESTQQNAVMKEIAGKTITLGIMPTITNATRTLPPAGSVTAQTSPTLVYQIATGTLDSNQLPQYQTLEARSDNPAGPLQDLTLVQLTLPPYGSFGIWNNLPPLQDGVGDYPPTVEDTDVLSRVLTWIRIRVQEAPDGTSTGPSVQAAFSWLGINAARITQRTQVFAEPLGTGTGDPDQTYYFVNTPVIPNSVQLAVDGVLWQQIADIMQAPPEVPVRDASLPPGATVPPSQISTPNVYVLDGESGQVLFGFGLKGTRPPAGAPIVANYAFGGSSTGNVGIGSIQSSPQLPAGFKITNPLPTWGGDDGESVTDAERNIPQYLQNGGRAVSQADFINIVQQTPGINLGRVEVLPVSDPGVVTLLVVPIDPQHPEAPQPNRLFLDSICNYLEPRRLLTTEVIVEGPDYVGLWVSIGIEVMPGRDIAPVREAVKQSIRTFLSPLNGGPTGEGWPLSKSVDLMDVWVQAVRVDGVSRVTNVLMWDITPSPQTSISISGLQLPRLDQISVAVGDPTDLTAAGSQGPTPTQKRVAVPVLPLSC
ncbi:MAG TPA: baseplate J/gp47 family protein [Candidatus Dormibacteraeota bacterium]|nr:baseplate J/gp47 family protein [Candidatus Dormibacteraeota bacterium]